MCTFIFLFSPFSFSYFTFAFLGFYLLKNIASSSGSELQLDLRSGENKPNKFNSSGRYVDLLAGSIQ
jgi:hypothetical protein